MSPSSMWSAAMGVGGQNHHSMPLMMRDTQTVSSLRGSMNTSSNTSAVRLAKLFVLALIVVVVLRWAAIGALHEMGGGVLRPRIDTAGASTASRRPSTGWMQAARWQVRRA